VQRRDGGGQTAWLLHNSGLAVAPPAGVWYVWLGVRRDRQRGACTSSGGLSRTVAACATSSTHTHTHIHSSINVNKAARVGARRAAARPALQRPYIAPPTAATAPPRPPLSLPPPLTFFTSSSSPDYFIKTCRQGRRRLPVRGLARRGTDRHGRSARAGCRRPRRRRR